MENVLEFFNFAKRGKMRTFLGTSILASSASQAILQVISWANAKHRNQNSPCIIHLDSESNVLLRPTGGELRTCLFQLFFSLFNTLYLRKNIRVMFMVIVAERIWWKGKKNTLLRVAWMLVCDISNFLYVSQS